jgi:molybdate transport system substrate-binding protein
VQGATGALFAQIKNGAPYDVFLSADAERPADLLEAGDAQETAPYAFGQLVLVSRQELAEAGDLTKVLAGQRIAVADPEIAPYGRAAAEVLDALELDPPATRIFGTSVGQAASIFRTGNAPLALIAASQVTDWQGGPLFIWDGELSHKPIRQDAALLRDSDASRLFFDTLSSPDTKLLIASLGYGVAE